MLLKKAAQILQPHLQIPEEQILGWLEIPRSPELGDAALPCFHVGKQWRKSPQAIAYELADQLNASPNTQHMTCSAAGPYLNLSFDRSLYGKLLLTEILQISFGQSQLGQGTRVIIDMSSPNIAKPFGIGHLRSTVIGNALYHLYKETGYDPVRVNHLGDWGTQFGKMIAAYKHWGTPAMLEQNPIKACLDLYVKFHQEAEAQPELEDEARDWFRKLEQGDEETVGLWRKFIQISMKEFNRMYEKLGVSFDYTLGESFYNDKMAEVVSFLREKEHLELSEGAYVVRLDERNLPPCLILKSNGTTIYPTRDLATALYRHREMKGSRLLYVVGMEQTLHFEQVFAVLEKAGFDWAQSCEHLAFGLMRFEGKKMSTRKGKIVVLEEVLDEAVGRALQIIERKNPDLPDKQRVAEQIGVGAVIFGDLKHNRLNEVDFSLEEALNFDGETGPYVQYAFARTQSILHKSGMEDSLSAGSAVSGTNGVYFESTQAWQLLKELLEYPSVVLKAVEKNEPSLLARYLIHAAQTFNRFYHQERILASDDEEKAAKVVLTYAAGSILQKGLRLLGIQTPSQI